MSISHTVLRLILSSSLPVIRSCRAVGAAKAGGSRACVTSLSRSVLECGGKRYPARHRFDMRAPFRKKQHVVIDSFGEKQHVVYVQ